MWARHDTTGRVAPLDVEPVDDGNLALRWVAGKPVYSVIPRAERDGLMHVSHYRTCPDAEAWRGRPPEEAA